MTRFLTIITLCTVLLAACPLWAATYPLVDVLVGTAVPSVITYKDISGEWRIFTLGMQQPDAKAMLLRQMVGDEDGEAVGTVLTPVTGFFTKGDLATGGGETFLIAYQRHLPTGDLASLLDDSERDAEEAMINAFLTTTPDSELSLCLLNTRQMSTLLNIRPFDYAREVGPLQGVVTRAQQRALETQSINNLKQLATATMMYAQENDENLPEVTADMNYNIAIDIVDRITISPISGEKYHFNLALSGKGLGEIADAAEAPMFYDPTPLPDGGCDVAFVDGHVARVSAEEWTELQQRWELK